jgi:transposase
MGDVNKRKLARTLKISRTTVRNQLFKLNQFNSQRPNGIRNFNTYISFIKINKPPSTLYSSLNTIFYLVFDSIVNSNSNRTTEWRKYREKSPNGYGFSQFSFYFSKWLNDNRLSIKTKKYTIKSISENDLGTLRRWRLSSDRKKWEKAVVILDSHNGKSLNDLSTKIERSRRKIKSWLKAYEIKGLDGLQKPNRKRNRRITQNIEIKKYNLIKLIHETPKNFGINRASWSLKTLSSAYLQKYGVTISTSMISEYIKSQGYVFRKAKKVLTSPDPNYREKLKNITNILSNLTGKQKFFSVDEFGPFAIKIQGGTSIVKNGEAKTFPQWQKSKGCLICTAGLELSQNQVTHFYSSRKNTDEMIKLLEILLDKYKDEEKIYFSWDAASWHASKKLKDKIYEVNKEEYRNINNTPEVELAPLPASAQFLNVIESVFSGMSKAIIHNSNYQSVDECKAAIDQYFKGRNEYFQKFPKRAGKKIWGKELNKPIFDESKNFKDSRWR